MVVVGHGLCGSDALHWRRLSPMVRRYIPTTSPDADCRRFRIGSQTTAAEVALPAAEKKAELLTIIATLEEKGVIEYGELS